MATIPADRGWYRLGLETDQVLVEKSKTRHKIDDTWSYIRQSYSLHKVSDLAASLDLRFHPHDRTASAMVRIGRSCGHVFARGALRGTLYRPSGRSELRKNRISLLIRSIAEPGVSVPLLLTTAPWKVCIEKTRTSPAL